MITSDVLELEPFGVTMGVEKNRPVMLFREKNGDERCQKPEETADMRRHHVFFGDQLNDVGQGLQQAMRTHAARTYP